MKRYGYYLLIALYFGVVAIILYVNGVFTGELLSLTNLAINLGFLLVMGILMVLAMCNFARLNRLADDLANGAAKLNSMYKENGHATVILTGSNYGEIFAEKDLKSALHRYCMRLEKYRTRNGYKEGPDIDEYIGEELFDRIGNTHFNSGIPGMMTGLGILGTFLGLAIGLGSFNGDDIYTISDNVSPLLTGMKVAFHTSVYGIFFSLTYSLIYRGFMAEIYRRIDSFQMMFRQTAQPVPVDKNADFASMLIYQANTANALKELLELQKGTSQAQLDQLQEITDRFVENMAQTAGVRLQGLGHQLQDVVAAENTLLQNNQALAQSMQQMVESEKALMEAVQESLENQRALASELRQQRGVLEKTNEDISNQLYTYQQMKTLSNP